MSAIHPTKPSPCIVAIGNFDGVHAGHQHLLNIGLLLADEHNMPLHVLTFTPHPRTVLRPDAPHRNLMTDGEKEAALLSLGVQEVHSLPFTPELIKLSPQQFETDILITALNAQHVLIGANFRYGHKAAGTPETLAHNPNFTTHIVDLLQDEHGVISSTRLRQERP